MSIDDNEQAYLKVLMDEIFGEENFVSNITWIKKHGPGGNTTFNFKIVNNTEYVLVYAKNINLKNFNYIIHDDKKLEKLGYTNKDEYFNERGYYKTTFLYRPSSTGSFSYSELLDYPIKAPDGTVFRLHVNKNGQKKGCYTWNQETFLEGDRLGFVEYKKNEDGDWVAFRKQYQFVKFDPKSKAVVKIQAGQQYENIIDDFYSQYGGAEIIKFFDDKNTFDFPKPSKLIKYLIRMADHKSSTILDFFAGSSTTGHAVMELNEEDGGNRRFILITNNENNIAQDICRERIYRVIHGCGSNNEVIEWKYSDDKKSLINNSMKYLKVQPIHKVDGEYEEINAMKELYKAEFDKDISIKDFIK